MLHSLRFRLFLTLISVVGLSVGTLALLTSRATTVEFQRYVEHDIDRTQSLIDTLMAYNKEHRSIAEVRALADQTAQTTGERIILADGEGTVIADSAHTLVGQKLENGSPIPAIVISFGQEAFFSAPLAGVATGNVNAAGPPDVLWIRGSALGPPEVGFLASVNRSLVLAVAIAVIVALLLTALLARGILGPIERLTVAVRKMEKGDLSQRLPVQSKNEIGELTHAFNAMADGLMQLERLRSNMVTDVAHELRTPLTNIRGYLEALRDGVIQPAPALIDSLHEEALLLNRLVDDLQEVALADAGQLKLVRQPVVLKEVIEQAVSALQPLLGEKELVVSLDVPADLPLVVADAERVGQVLRNLLNNARTHTPHGGAISVTARPIDSAVAVSVRDSGIGIAAEHLPSIFERFFRADHSRTRATGGAGLGLTIVRQLVEAHGGRVWAESTPGVGSVFTFTLPSGNTDAL
jgi:signal transduction histidine kinase